ncbi:COBW domain-containing protein [Penicillium diatomitis]|uniref:COBW domain-containing protein n=1 Tax=Penicillium diatomitis TaxID=2819901 RepID=A0A9W9XFH8_9EURO|nr:COBW domain-containing protein [Penicillium diatomitis]KAJ5490793.1 COBW domain-containing protein [Penicillium diatomitis]
MVIHSGRLAESIQMPTRLEQEPGPKQLPVTLLSGFLGSGKTTLLKHILKSTDHGLRIAVIVNDMSQLNIDAALIKNHKVSKPTEKVIQLQNGCICCTLRGDLLSELGRLAKQNDIEYVIIESTGISEPMQVAETFTTEFSTAMLQAEDQMADVDDASTKILREIAEMGGLHKIARLDTTVTVIDAFNLLSNFDTAEFLSDRYGRDEIIPEDERTISDLMVDQIEFADVLMINKIETVDSATRERITRLINLLNPNAKVLLSSYSQVDVREIVATNRFDFVRAASGSGWLRSLHEMTLQQTGNGERLAPKPETLEYGINNFVYSARRPFHPRRLFSLDFDQPETEEILKNKRNHPAFASILRSKGFFWLCTRPFQFGEWSQAGAMLTVGCGGPWFAELPDQAWPEDKDVRKSIENDFAGPWGDRRQELVFIGEGVDPDAISALLDGCLISEEEMQQWEGVMCDSKLDREEKMEILADVWEDGWEDWPELDLDDDQDDHTKHRASHALVVGLGHEVGSHKHHNHSH